MMMITAGHCFLLLLLPLFYIILINRKTETFRIQFTNSMMVINIMFFFRLLLLFDQWTEFILFCSEFYLLWNGDVIFFCSVKKTTTTTAAALAIFIFTFHLINDGGDDDDMETQNFWPFALLFSLFFMFYLFKCVCV